MAILNLGKDGSLVEVVVNAITGGYRDDLVLEELAQAIEDEKVTKEQFEAAVQALQLYKARFVDSLENITNAMSQFEFNEKQSILKSRPVNLAQQVLKDVEGFDNATNEFYSDEDNQMETEPEPSIPEKVEEPEKPAPAPKTEDEDTEVKDKDAEVKDADIQKPNVNVKKEI